MLINADIDMSENCGECGIILTPEPYTRTTVVFKCVWSFIVLMYVFLSEAYSLEQHTVNSMRPPVSLWEKAPTLIGLLCTAFRHV